MANWPFPHTSESLSSVASIRCIQLWVAPQRVSASGWWSLESFPGCSSGGGGPRELLGVFAFPAGRWPASWVGGCRVSGVQRRSLLLNLAPAPLPQALLNSKTSWLDSPSRAEIAKGDWSGQGCVVSGCLLLKLWESSGFGCWAAKFGTDDAEAPYQTSGSEKKLGKARE